MKTSGESVEGLKIVRGGKLLKTKWHYDEAREAGSYVTEDVSENVPRHLFEACTLDEDVVLKDIFRLLERHLALYQTIISHWVEALVREGLQDRAAEADELAYVELYWQIDYDLREPAFEGNTFPAFHGIGKDGTPFSLMLTPANEIAALPLKLNPKFVVSRYSETGAAETEVFLNPRFSLGQILYAIIWELSWFGSPENREREAQALRVSADKSNVQPYGSLADAPISSGEQGKYEVREEV